MGVRNNAIQIFSDIFISSQLNTKNKVQLSSHLLLHIKGIQESLVAGKGSKKSKPKDGISKERKIAKLVSIASAAYMIALGMVKKNVKEIDQQVFGNVEGILRICMTVENQFLNRISSEGLVMLYKQATTPEYVMSIIEMTMAKLNEEVESGAKD